MAVANPVIIPLMDNKKALNSFYNSLEDGIKENDLIKNYPTVYIHNWEKSDKFEVYVGESNNFFQRTEQHYEQINNPNSWQKNIKNNNAKLFVIAHPEFNKSLTLDVENRLIHYLSSSNSVLKVHNGRGNPQNQYYPCEDFDEIFSKIWRKLRVYNKALFLSESEIKDSAIFKASPLHKLNFKQSLAKEKILDKVAYSMVGSDKEHKLIWVQGDAGTGKTVLMSSIFYELINRTKKEVEDDFVNEINVETAIIVNHTEQLTVYEEIVKKLDLVKDNEKVVYNPTQFINLFVDKKNSPKKRTKLYDVIFVDEAHLLLTQKNQAFTGENGQLVELMKYAKTVVVMFDKKQVMNAEQYLSNDTIDEYINIAKSQDNFIELDEQMRMNVNPKVMRWLRKFYLDGVIEPLTAKRGDYDIKSFDTPKALENAIKQKAGVEETKLSRMVATYDWPFSGQSEPTDDKYWNDKIGEWSKPWNREIMRHSSKKENRITKGLAWAEQPQTIDEIGSIYTIQGFDLNYAGVIIGPSVKFRNGHIIFDPTCSCNDKATHKRTLADGSKKSFGEEFLKNELGVLLTRGVNGLYIYACDDELREQLNKCL